MRQHAGQKKSRPLDKEGAEKERGTPLEECVVKLTLDKVYSQMSFICWRPHHSCTNVCIAVTSQLLYYRSCDTIKITTECLFLSFFSSVFFTGANACPAVEEVELRRDGVVAASAEQGCSEVLVWVCVRAVGGCRRMPSGQGSRWGQVRMKPGRWGDCLHEANDWANG